MTSDKRQRVVVTGGETGSVGSAVVAALRERNGRVVAPSRDADRARERLGAGVDVHASREPVDHRPPRDAFASAYAVVHLLVSQSATGYYGAAAACIRQPHLEPLLRDILDMA